MNRAVLDELQNLRAQRRVTGFAHAEFVGKRSEFDAWSDQARQTINDRLSIVRRHEMIFLLSKCVNATVVAGNVHRTVACDRGSGIYIAGKAQAPAQPALRRN